MQRHTLKQTSKKWISQVLGIGFSLSALATHAGVTFAFDDFYSPQTVQKIHLSMDAADMRTFFILMLLGVIVAGAAGVVYAAKIKVGTAVTFPVDI